LRDNSKVTNVSKVPRVPSVPSVPSVTKIPPSEDTGNFCDTGDFGAVGDIADTGDNAQEAMGDVKTEERAKANVECATCGKDITNKTQLTKNDKTYCRECGYPSEQKECASCPVALKGDKSAIKCNPCIYIGRAEA
jgi:DNA-directed RNA polymerase subunit RPC12/RpoP